MLLDTIAREKPLDDLVPSGLECDHAHVSGVALVARSRVRDVHQAHFHESTSTCVWTTDLSTNAGQYATISSTFGRPPANPVTLGGPLSTSGAISRVNLSTVALSAARTPTRNWTS